MILVRLYRVLFLMILVRLYRILFLIIVMLCFTSGAVLAQDVSGVEEVPVLVEGVADELLVFLFVPIAAPLVQFILQVLKSFVPIGWSMKAMNIAVSLIVWLVYIFANQAGYIEAFNDLIPFLTTLMTTVAAIFLTPVSSSWLYEQNKAHTVPYLGFQRTSPE